MFCPGDRAWAETQWHRLAEQGSVGGQLTVVFVSGSGGNALRLSCPAQLERHGKLPLSGGLVRGDMFVASVCHGY